MNSETSTQSFKDGILEVLGLYSSFHIAQLQVGLSTPHKIGQARNVEVTRSIYLFLLIMCKNNRCFIDDLFSVILYFILNFI